MMLAIALSYWLDRYQLLYSPAGSAYGASYTSVNVELPIYTGLSVLAAGLAIGLLGKALLGANWQRDRLFVVILLYGLVAAIATYFLPVAVQRLVVQPNELQLEQPYLKRTIALTRQAFGLEPIEVKTFDPNNALTEAELQQNNLTVSNKCR